MKTIKEGFTKSNELIRIGQELDGFHFIYVGTEIKCFCVDLEWAKYMFDLIINDDYDQGE